MIKKLLFYQGNVKKAISTNLMLKSKIILAKCKRFKKAGKRLLKLILLMIVKPHKKIGISSLQTSITMKFFYILDISSVSLLTRNLVSYSLVESSNKTKCREPPFQLLISNLLVTFEIYILSWIVTCLLRLFLRGLVSRIF